MRTVILVPRREGKPDRDALWAYCRTWWQTEFPDWPLIEGHHERFGPFNRSAAINAAAELAGDWDVAVIIDADVLIHPPNVVTAVELARGTDQMTVPFHVRHNVNQVGTNKIVRDNYRGSWQQYAPVSFQAPAHLQVSSVIAVPRRLWDAIGGFDEAFEGWGFEDTAFAIACEMIGGRPIGRIDGDCWHLHHATDHSQKQGSWTHVRNSERKARYEAAQSLGDRAVITEMFAEGKELERNRAAFTIPRILHRVVPKRSPLVAEQWWARFGELHPDWRLMTHRDPLDPKDWPLTSPHWSKVENGAQLADLVRLEALLRWGGVYVDQDVEPFRALDPFLGAQVFAAYEDERVIPNAILGARPDHPLIKQCLDEAVLRMTKRKGTWEAGPGVTTTVLGGSNEVLLLPPGTFYPVDYRDPDRDRKMNAKPAPWTYARHAYWGSWLEPERQRVPA